MQRVVGGQVRHRQATRDLGRDVLRAAHDEVRRHHDVGAEHARGDVGRGDRDDLVADGEVLHRCSGRHDHSGALGTQGDIGAGCEARVDAHRLEDVEEVEPGRGDPHLQLVRRRATTDVDPRAETVERAGIRRHDAVGVGLHGAARWLHHTVPEPTEARHPPSTLAERDLPVIGAAGELVEQLAAADARTVEIDQRATQRWSLGGNDTTHPPRHRLPGRRGRRRSGRLSAARHHPQPRHLRCGVGLVVPRSERLHEREGSGAPQQLGAVGSVEALSGDARRPGVDDAAARAGEGPAVHSAVVLGTVGTDDEIVLTGLTERLAGADDRAGGAAAGEPRRQVGAHPVGHVDDPVRRRCARARQALARRPSHLEQQLVDVVGGAAGPTELQPAHLDHDVAIGIDQGRVTAHGLVVATGDDGVAPGLVDGGRRGEHVHPADVHRQVGLPVRRPRHGRERDLQASVEQDDAPSDSGARASARVGGRAGRAQPPERLAVADPTLLNAAERGSVVEPSGAHRHAVRLTRARLDASRSDRGERSGPVGRCRRGADHGVRVRTPCQRTCASLVDREHAEAHRPRPDALEQRLHGVTATLIDRQRLDQPQVRDRERPRAGRLRGGGGGHLDEPGRREDGRVAHDVIAQEREIPVEEVGLPQHGVRLERGMHSGPQQRVPARPCRSRRLRLVPEALTLPWVRRQSDVATLADHGGPVDRHAGGIQGRQTGEHRRPLGFATPQRRRHLGAAAVAEHLLDRRDEDRMRADLDEHHRTVGGELGRRQRRTARAGAGCGPSSRHRASVRRRPRRRPWIGRGSPSPPGRDRRARHGGRRAADPSAGCVRRRRPCTGRQNTSPARSAARTVSKATGSPEITVERGLLLTAIDSSWRCAGDGRRGLLQRQVDDGHRAPAAHPAEQGAAAADHRDGVVESSARRRRRRRPPRPCCGRPLRPARRPTPATAPPAPPAPRTASAGSRRSRRADRRVARQPSCSSGDQPPSSRIAASHVSIASRNTGSRASSSRAIPRHCEPWPGNTNTTRGGPPAETPAASPACGWTSMNAAQPVGNGGGVRADDREPVFEVGPAQRAGRADVGQ